MLDRDDVVSLPQRIMAVVAPGLEIGPEHLGLVALMLVVIPVAHDVAEPFTFESASLTHAVVAPEQSIVNGGAVAADHKCFGFAFITTPLAAALWHFDAAPPTQRPPIGAAL